MAIDLRGKPILITGASSGIGRATALACARAGMPVAVAARRLDKLHDLVATIERQRDTHGAAGQAIAVECNVDDPGACSRLFGETTRAFGLPYAVYANAGYGVERAIHEMTDAELRAIFETNFFGTMNTIRPAVEAFLQAGRGHVIVCSSCLSKTGIARGGAYSATKACQDHIARAMRLELEDRGVFVSSVHPIGTRTEFFQQTTVRTGRETDAAGTPERFMQPPERVADAIVRCLRRPRGEVWTSRTVRMALGLFTAWPGLGDRFLRRYARFRSKVGGDAQLRERGG